MKTQTVIGGGLAGLTASLTLARRGVKADAASRLTTAAIRMNLGPRALYLGGAAARILRGLGIPLQGRKALGGESAGRLAYDGGGAAHEPAFRRAREGGDRSGHGPANPG